MASHRRGSGVSSRQCVSGHRRLGRRSRPAQRRPHLGLVAACTTGGAGPRPSSAALPTGLVGPVAPTVGPQALRYVALGDSYTFGDGVHQMDRWPNQLVRILRPGPRPRPRRQPGRRGASPASESSRSSCRELEELEPRFVSVQVGANDVVFDTPPADYAANIAPDPGHRARVGRARTGWWCSRRLTSRSARRRPAPRTTPRLLGARRGVQCGSSRRSPRERGVALVDITPIATG